jgi:hypothetical protein
VKTAVLAVSFVLASIGTVLAGDLPSPKEWELVTMAGKFQHVWISKEQEGNRSLYEKIIAQLCPTKGWCGISFWTDRTVIPMRLPMSEAQSAAQVASFIYNPASNYRRLLFSCRINPNPKDCFR